MTLESIIAMILIVGFVTGSFGYLVSKAMKKERGE